MGDMPMAIVGTGMLTSVGYSSAVASAALRCRMNQFRELAFDDVELPITAAPIQPDGPETQLDPAQKLGGWMAEAAAQARAALPSLGAADLPVLACLMEPGRPGRPEGWDHALVNTFLRHHGRPHAHSQSFQKGPVALVHALRRARELLYAQRHPAVLVVAADSWLLPETLTVLVEIGRCLNAENSSGFVPGEAAAALLLARPHEEGEGEQLFCTGTGLALEPSRLDNEMPNTAIGLSQALRQAGADAAQDAADTDLLLADLSGESFYADEACAAGLRIFQGCVQAPALWLPAESLGATGAAAGLLAAGWLLESQRRDYAPGFNTLLHLANDDGQRGAVAFTYL